MKTLVFIAALFMNVLVGETQADSVAHAHLDVFENHIQENGYKLEEAFASIEKVNIKNWPQKVRQTIYVKLWENQAPFLEDPRDLANFTRDFGIGVNYSGSIIRSFEINLDEEVLYLAIYLVYGGEYGREKSFLEYYFLSESGELLRTGMRRAD